MISYCLGIASGIFGIFTRQYTLGCLILAYSQMQLSEALIWYGIDHNDDCVNRAGTTFGKYLLATHNFAIGIGIILSVLFVSKRKLKWTDFLPILAGLGLFLFVVFYIYLPKKYPGLTFPRRSTCNNKCQSPENRLLWPYPKKWYMYSFGLSVVVVLFYVKPMVSKILLLSFFGALFIVSSLIYPHTLGSVWCWTTSFCAPVIVMVNYYLIRELPGSEILV